MNVYGSVLENRKMDFLTEIKLVVKKGDNAIMIGGDFNLIRKVEEKSSERVNVRWMDPFNGCIAYIELRGLHRLGGRYTWSNNKDIPIRVVLDRMLVSTKWEEQFPLSTVQVVTKVGLDHTPLPVDSNQDGERKPRIFRFESTWLMQDGFKIWLISKWPSRGGGYIMDHLHRCSKILRRNLKG